MADAADAGLQSVLMAPTEILARQHYETVVGPLEAQGVCCLLLTGRDKGAARAEKLRALAGGEVAVAIGTHALFQDDVVFKALALAVIDEQHRFGVNERSRLQDVFRRYPCPPELFEQLWAAYRSFVDGLGPVASFEQFYTARMCAGGFLEMRANSAFGLLEPLRA